MTSKLRLLFLFIVVAISFAGCSSNRSTSDVNQSEHPINNSDQPKTNEKYVAIETEVPSVLSVMTEVTEAEPVNETEQLSDIDISNIEVVGVDSELHTTVMSLLETLRANDTHARLALMHTPEFDPFELMLPNIVAVTKIELDSSRLQAVIEEYELNKIARETSIVTITFITKNKQGELSEAKGDYIFIKLEDRWKLYRYQ